MTPDPTAVQTYEVSPEERAVIRAALDASRGFLLTGDIPEEEQEAERVLERFNATADAEPVSLREIDAARAVAACSAYKQWLLDAGDVPRAADAEEAARTLGQQNGEIAAMMTEDGL